jgi:hypothetical protein
LAFRPDHRKRIREVAGHIFASRRLSRDLVGGHGEIQDGAPCTVSNVQYVDLLLFLSDTEYYTVNMRLPSI